jgi:hypothetical protein
MTFRVGEAGQPRAKAAEAGENFWVIERDQMLVVGERPPLDLRLRLLLMLQAGQREREEDSKGGRDVQRQGRAHQPSQRQGALRGRAERIEMSVVAYYYHALLAIYCVPFNFSQLFEGCAKGII